MSHRMNSAAALRFADRRKREEEAPRLGQQVPNLRGLRLEIEERTGIGGTKHVRCIMIDRAPALFLIQCGDPRCIDGEHDLSGAVMQALRAGKTAFGGSDECRGSIGTSSCARVLHFQAQAEYGA